jgi:hypothetical protein
MTFDLLHDGHGATSRDTLAIVPRLAIVCENA